MQTKVVTSILEGAWKTLIKDVALGGIVVCFAVIILIFVYVVIVSLTMGDNYVGE